MIIDEYFFYKRKLANMHLPNSTLKTRCVSPVVCRVLKAYSLKILQIPLSVYVSNSIIEQSPAK